MRKLLLALLVISLALLVSFSQTPAHADAFPAPHFSSAAELIAAVNSLRASYGLPPYSPNSILMGIAQGQADYILSSGKTEHTDAAGLLPYQRALNAGYPVAGDLSQGGFFSENITMGVGMTAEDAVENWTGDSPHLTTMISSNHQDIGAGVAVSGDIFYYVIDCGLSTGGTPVPYSPPLSLNPARSTFVPNTPNADGSVTYIVRPGDTILGIALANGLNLDELLALNGLTANSVIYPNQVIIVRTGFTPTPIQPTGTPTGRPSITSWPTSTHTPSKTSTPPTPAPSPGLPVSATRNTVTLIIVVTLIAAAFIAFLSRGRRL